MTKKQYTYSELNNGQYSVDYITFEEIYGEENIFYNRICEVSNKKQVQKVVALLNEQEVTIKSLENEARRQNKQKKNLINYLKIKKHYGIGKIRKIMNKEWW